LVGSCNNYTLSKNIIEIRLQYAGVISSLRKTKNIFPHAFRELGTDTGTSEQ
jgi:hypothetical protein